jgi:putative flippase GtrA
MNIRNNDTVQTLLRFVVIGGLSTLTYLLISIGLVKALGVRPSIASILAILCGFVVSYVGHHQFTFRMTGRHAVHLPRFGAMQATIFTVLGSLSTFILEHHLADPTMTSLGIAAAWPPISFLISRLWVFKHAASK